MLIQFRTRARVLPSLVAADAPDAGAHAARFLVLRALRSGQRTDGAALSAVRSVEHQVHTGVPADRDLLGRGIVVVVDGPARRAGRDERLRGRRRELADTPWRRTSCRMRRSSTCPNRGRRRRLRRRPRSPRTHPPCRGQWVAGQAMHAPDAGCALGWQGCGVHTDPLVHVAPHPPHSWPDPSSRRRRAPLQLAWPARATESSPNSAARRSRHTSRRRRRNRGRSVRSVHAPLQDATGGAAGSVDALLERITRALPQAPAVCRIRQRVDAAPTARRLAAQTVACDTRAAAGRAHRGAGRGDRRGADAAFRAEVDGLAGAAALLGVVGAFIGASSAGAHLTGSAGMSAAAAVLRVGIDVDAAVGAMRLAGRAARLTSAATAHLGVRTRLPATVAVGVVGEKVRADRAAFCRGTWSR